MVTADGRVPVAHIGTGATGAEALKGILRHPELKLVSLWVNSRDKIGRDAGELVGLPPVGISAVGSLHEALDAGPAVLSYCGHGIGREADVVKEAAIALRQGVDVATTSLLNMLYPPAGPAELRANSRRPPRPARPVFCPPGWIPGVSSDLLPMALLSMSDAVEHVLIQEFGIYDHYDVEPIIRGVMGFGQPPSYQAPISTGGAFVAYWGGMVRQLADRMSSRPGRGRRVTSDFAVHDVDIETSVGPMEAGTVVARRIACEGRIGGRAVITAEHITRMVHEVAPDWPRFEGVGESNYRDHRDRQSEHAMRPRSG